MSSTQDANVVVRRNGAGIASAPRMTISTLVQQTDTRDEYVHRTVCSPIVTVDNPGPGTHVYEAEATGGNFGQLSDATLIVMELAK